MDDRPPGLIYRFAFEPEPGRVVVQEHWDISVPGCPMIRNPWATQLDSGNNYIRQVTMTADEYKAAKPKLFG